MHDITPKLTMRDILGYAIAYMFWLLAALIALAAILVLRTALNTLLPAMGINRWVLRPIDRFGLVFLGLVWLVYVIFCEHHLRSSITEVRIRRLNAAMRAAPRSEQASKSKLMAAMKRLGLDILARRLVPTMAIPLVVLGLAYLVYWASWRLLAT